MNLANNVLFSSDLWEQALERYARSTHLTVKLFDAEERVVFGPIHPTPFFQLFEEIGYDPGMFADCARRCLEQTESRPTVIVSEVYGLTVVGTSLVLEGKVVGAAVGGYSFLDFFQLSEIQRLARDAGIKFERLWQVAREQKPVPKNRLILSGELLQVLGDALLRENHRTRQCEVVALKLEEVARAKDQIRQEFHEQEERLRRSEKMASAGQLAASMAHEINNPLSSVTNALYLLENQEKKLSESARLLVNLAATELARVSRIVKHSLSYYRVGTIPRHVDLSGIVNESLQVFSEQFQKAGIELKPRIESATLLGFPDELRQVIDNLLLNALEAMPGGGGLSISVHTSFDWTRHNNHRKGPRLTIADSGVGIPKMYRSRISEPFFTTKMEKGNGLGLWVSHGIISKHKGVMSLRSSDTEGKSGTVVSIFLPSNTRASRKSKAGSAV